MDYGFKTKKELLAKFRAYSDTPDDDNIRIKKKIKETLLNCPELLYALHYEDYESELFNEDGSLNEDGEWSIYFGNNAPIRPYLSFPTVETDTNSYISYQVSFKDSPRYNDTEKYCLITFNIFVYTTNNMDKETGIPRHDLLASIIRERMAWSGIARSNAVPISDTESTTDTNFVVRTLVYQATVPNSLVTTTNGITKYSNKGR